jgi:RimJ/RimL family protein N-acetyltransferase
MTKREIPPVEYDRIRLRLLEEKDLILTLKWRNQDHIRRWFFHSDLISYEQHKSWFQKYRKKDNDFVFIIEQATQNNRPVGQVALYNIDWTTGQGEFGRLMIGEKDAAGIGLAFAATQAALLIAQKYLNLRELYLEVYQDNHRAIKIYQSAGFTIKLNYSDILKMIIKLERD